MESIRDQVDSWQRRALILGGVGLLLSVAGALVSTEQFFQSYLFAYLFWVSLALGCFAILMVHLLAGGEWGFMIRRVVESGAMTLPLMALLFVPLLFGMGDLYEWARPAAVAADEVLQQKQWYLNVPFYVIRLIVYFGIWIGMAYLLHRWSRRQDEAGDNGIQERMRVVSAPGLVIFVLTVTFSAFDWGMSLEPHWYSTIYGMLFLVGHGLAGVAFATALLVVLANRTPLSDIVEAKHYNDLGSLLLTFVILWAYIAFSQWLIIWSGNLTEEIPWYLHRGAGGWQWLIIAVIAFHFAVPFVILLSRARKRNPRVLYWLSLTILVLRLVDWFWLVMPAFYPGTFHIHWLDIVTPIGIGGIWVAVFLWYLKAKPLLPQNDPRFENLQALVLERG